MDPELLLRTVPNVFRFSLPICTALHFILHFKTYQLFSLKVYFGYFLFKSPKEEKKKQSSVSSVNIDDESGFLPSLRQEIPFICDL